MHYYVYKLLSEEWPWVQESFVRTLFLASEFSRYHHPAWSLTVAVSVVSVVLNGLLFCWQINMKQHCCVCTSCKFKSKCSSSGKSSAGYIWIVCRCLWHHFSQNMSVSVCWCLQVNVHLLLSQSLLTSSSDGKQPITCHKIILWFVDRLVG